MPSLIFKEDDKKYLCRSNLLQIYSDAYHQLGEEMDLNLDVNIINIMGIQWQHQY